MVAVGGGEAGASARTEEDGELGHAGERAEREAAGPAAPAPFSLFLNFFFQKSLNVNFEAFAKFFGIWGKKRNVPHKILYNFASKCKSKFQTEFELQIRTCSRFFK